MSVNIGSSRKVSPSGFWRVISPEVAGIEALHNEVDPRGFTIGFDIGLDGDILFNQAYGKLNRKLTVEELAAVEELRRFVEQRSIHGWEEYSKLHPAA